MARWWEQYHCGCVSGSVERKSDLRGRCPEHGDSALHTHREERYTAAQIRELEAAETELVALRSYIMERAPGVPHNVWLAGVRQAFVDGAMYVGTHRGAAIEEAERRYPAAQPSPPPSVQQPDASLRVAELKREAARLGLFELTLNDLQIIARKPDGHIESVPIRATEARIILAALSVP